MWDQLKRDTGEDGFIEMPLDGWSLSIAWVVATEVSPELLRLRRGSEPWVVRETITDAKGVTTKTSRPVTDAEIDEVRDCASLNLNALGAPLPPRGFVVPLKLPYGLTSASEFWSAVERAASEDGFNYLRPETAAHAFRTVVPPLYSPPRNRH
ncbi:hypothetical protein FHX48_000412 [Microbacterium halimionae]|uniref:Uncharacterized protein n=1 Tax=Microbacterium halimionae TaxID=1526413 RepID=A0A7W3JM30_9MICO|nr:DUF5956 family protein [Microbacterium halimionae]MBA8815360.1 hypothetical protein [Microbacterium halimionae]NII93849.1 hypothetical protein [Microbacterium halimionae]